MKVPFGYRLGRVSVVDDFVPFELGGAALGREIRGLQRARDSTSSFGFSSIRFSAAKKPENESSDS